VFTARYGLIPYSLLKVNLAVPCLLWINLFNSCKVNIALQWSIIRQPYKKKHVMCTSCMVDSVEMAPGVRISRTCIVFGVIIGVLMCSSCSNMLPPLLLMPTGVGGMSFHIHFVGFLHGIAYSMCGAPHRSSLKNASSIHLHQRARRFACLCSIQARRRCPLKYPS
jgi:hypothetical protein